MDGSAPQNRAQPAPQQQSSLIRPEQVSRLPQLNPQQKQQYEAGVRRLWEVLNSGQQGEPKYNEAYQKLVQTSQQLMQGMKNFQQAAKQRQVQQAQQQQAQQAQAAQQAQQAAQAAQAQQAAQNASQAANGASSVQFNQLMPEIQQKVNEQHFYYPPAMIEGTKGAEEWLREAKARFGQALQRLQVAKTKKAEFQRQAQQRQQQGNPLNPQESEVFNNKLAQCNKAIMESTSFMEKFREQQNQFRQAQPQHQYTKQGVQGPSGEGSTEQPNTATLQPGVQGPTAHSISSAVSAARNQASAAQGGSPPSAPTQPNTNATPTTQSTPQQPFQGADPMSARPSSHQGQPGQPSALQHLSQSSIHAHPLSASINGAKPVTAQPITKNLQVAEPKSVQMPPSRPTLNGGAGVGLPGQLGQPALTTLPGYVLESSEDGRLLSKKKLNELVREVCGPGPEEQLTPEAEEIFLQVADDFVDDLVAAGCKLAKLRGSATLEARDLQMVLERQYNLRIPGYSTDEIRTVRRPQPAAAWAHKMSAVQAAKLTGGGGAAAVGANKDN